MRWHLSSLMYQHLIVFATCKSYRQQSKLPLRQWSSNSTALPSPPAPNAWPSSYTRNTSPENSMASISQLVNINRPRVSKYQPFGEVRFIEDDGFVLYQSRAICRYIAEKYAGQGTALTPMELKAKAIFEQAASVEKDNFDALADKAVYEKVVKPTMHGLSTNQEAFDELIGNLYKRLNVYDQILSKQKLPAAGSNILDTKPNVARWWKDITSRPCWIAVKDGVKFTA